MDSYLIYLLVRGTMAFLGSIPRLIATPIVDILADIAFFIDLKRRNIALLNLSIAFPEFPRRERKRIARKSFHNVARNLLEMSRILRLNAQNVSELVRYDEMNGLNNYREARARGKTILYLTGHFSAWELLPFAHALYGYPLSFITRPLDNPYLERYLRRLREASGNEVITKKDSARPILEKLHRGVPVGILMDQNTTTLEGTFVDFFGIPATTSTSLALFALRTDATVLAGYLTPMYSGRYTMKFMPPIELIRTGDMNQDLVQNTRRFNELLEKIIREQPESWFWGHKRWKYQPDENPQDLYALSEKELIDFVRSKRVGERS